MSPRRATNRRTSSWTAPASDGGSTISSYTATSSPDSLTCTTATLGCTVTGLTNGTAYTFTVTATNNVGDRTALRAVRLDHPRHRSPTRPRPCSRYAGDQQVEVSWDAPAADGGSAISSYTATSSPDGLTCTTTGVDCTVTGLTNGTPYTFTVTATNGIGSGPAGGPSNTVTPSTVPDAPTSVSATPGDQQADVTWSAPRPTAATASRATPRPRRRTV